MKFKHCEISKNLLTRQRAVFKSKRRGESQRAIDNRLTCQRALCNRGKRQGDSPHVIDIRLTCQQALLNRGKRQGDDQRVIDTDLVHGSSTTVQNRVQLREKLSRTYQESIKNLSETSVTLYDKQLATCATLVCVHESQGDFGNIKSKVNETSHNHFITSPPESNHTVYANIKSQRLFTLSVQTQCVAFNRSRAQTRSHLIHAKKRDREPSRIPMKKLVHLMSKNKKRRRKIKSLIKQLIPKSSSWHNLLSTRYRKHIIQK